MATSLRASNSCYIEGVGYLCLLAFAPLKLLNILDGRESEYIRTTQGDMSWHSVCYKETRWLGRHK